MGVFRITRAEFAKVFKKPTVYIMAFILAIVLVITLLTYSPTTREEKSISIEGDNASKIYAIFTSESTTYDTKARFDEKYIDFTNNQIEFYTNIYLKSSRLNAELDMLKNNLSLLNAKYTTNNNDGSLSELLETTKLNFEKIIDYYGDISMFSKYEKLNNIIISTNAKGNKYYEIKYFDTIENGTTYSYTTLKNKYIPELKAESSVDIFLEKIKTNNYIGIFENLNTYGSNLIYNILKDQLNEIKLMQNEYIKLVGSSQSQEVKELVRTKIIELNSKITQFKAFVDGLTSNDVVLTLHTVTNNEKFANAYDNFRNIYDTVKINDVNDYTSKKASAIALRESSYLNEFDNYIDSLSFINLDKEIIDSLANYKSTAQKNQTIILEAIEQQKNEIASANIINSITNYMLLGETYKEIIQCEILNAFSNNVELSKMQDAKNIDLANYNDYENTNKISQLTYQLNNNVYSNDIGEIFSLNQTITTKENVYDFVYYALKISTLLITIFTIMMIANLITSETDSGTIKLLLIRPYRRGTVLMGKIIATFFFSLSFLLLALAISFVSGYFMFGLPIVDKVLVTFNATKTFLINPLWLILIFLASCAMDILFYLIVALTVSVLFKSYIGAISTSLIIYIGASVVGSFLANSPVYAYLPFTNISLFRYFGGEIMGVKSGIGALLASPVHSFQNIWLSIGVSSIFSIILLIITFATFKRRDF